MINNVEDLLEQANKKETIEDKTKFIMNFFLENVKYDYACLFAYGYAQGTVSGVSELYGYDMNRTRAYGDEEFSLTRSIIQGESRIFNELLQLRDKNSGNYNGFIEELRNYIKAELNTHLQNEEIVSQSVENVIQQIELGLRQKMKVNFNGCELEMNYDISKVLIDFILEPKKFFPPQLKNGLITNGVCEDYTNYLVPLLQKAGIEAHGVEGTSELGHAWVIIRDGDKYKSIDLTRAVFIRDGFLGIPKEQTSEDWLYSNIEDIFKMQETRSISKIDGKKLPYVINGQSYDETDFMKIMEEYEIGESGLKNGIRKEKINSIARQTDVAMENENSDKVIAEIEGKSKEEQENHNPNFEE